MARMCSIWYPVVDKDGFAAGDGPRHVLKTGARARRLPFYESTRRAIPPPIFYTWGKGPHPSPTKKRQPHAKTAIACEGGPPKTPPLLIHQKQRGGRRTIEPSAPVRQQSNCHHAKDNKLIEENPHAPSSARGPTTTHPPRTQETDNPIKRGGWWWWGAERILGILLRKSTFARRTTRPAVIETKPGLNTLTTATPGPDNLITMEAQCGVKTQLRRGEIQIASIQEACVPRDARYILTEYGIITPSAMPIPKYAPGEPTSGGQHRCGGDSDTWRNGPTSAT